MIAWVRRHFMFRSEIRERQIREREALETLRVAYGGDES